MTEINKQKFLSEFAKLLTFMYEEDRQRTLQLYNELFDSAADEQALLAFFGSPTRQAVVIARAYNAKERKLQVHTTSRENDLYNDSDEIPDFVVAIEQIKAEAVDKKIIATDVLEDQFVLFDDGIHPTPQDDDVPADAPKEESPVVGDIPAPVEAAEADINTVYAPADRAEVNPVEDAHEADDEIKPSDEVSPADGEVVPEGTQNQVQAAENDVEELPAVESTEELPSDEHGDTAQEIEKSLGFKYVPYNPDILSQDKAEFTPVPEAETKADEEPVEPPAPASKQKDISILFEDLDSLDSSESSPSKEAVALKANVPLLVLYIILAVPVGLLAVAILLLPTLLFLLLAVVAVTLSIMGISSAFGNFVVFADVMVVLGAGIILMALGILFLWTFVWFIGGAIVGTIGGLVKLGKKWCYKEVRA